MEYAMVVTQRFMLPMATQVRTLIILWLFSQLSLFLHSFLLFFGSFEARLEICDNIKDISTWIIPIFTQLSWSYSDWYSFAQQKCLKILIWLNKCRIICCWGTSPHWFAGVRSVGIAIEPMNQVGSTDSHTSHQLQSQHLALQCSGHYNSFCLRLANKYEFEGCHCTRIGSCNWNPICSSCMKNFRCCTGQKLHL